MLQKKKHGTCISLDERTSVDKRRYEVMLEESEREPTFSLSIDTATNDAEAESEEQQDVR